MELERINYRSCVEALLPPLVEHCAAKSEPNELDRFLTKLGPDAAPVVCSILYGMDDAAKNKMVVWLAGAHEERMRNAANRHLAELLGGPVIRVGRLLVAELPEGRMALEAARVEVDYPALLKSPLAAEGIERLGAENGLLKGAAKLAMQLGAHMSSEQLEKSCLTMLNSDKLKARLMAMLTDAIARAGLDVVPSNLTVEDGSVIRLPESLTDTSGQGLIPDAFEDALMDALAARLRTLRRDDEQA